MITVGSGVLRAHAQVSLPAPAPQNAPRSTPAAPNSAREAEIRGVWIHTYQAWDWDATMRNIAAAGFNCVFVRVARGVNAIYPSQYLPRDGWAEAANLDEMRTAIDAAHKYGLQFHAWKVNFNSNAGMRAGPGPSALYQQMAKEDRLIRDPQGNQATSLNPADPRNQELEFNVMMEMATKYDVDGIHFDYIRYPDTPHYDFDYGDVSRREFEKTLGHAVNSWPEDVISGSLKIQYEDWERENINRLVQRVYAAAKKARPELQVSAAVWRAHRKHRATVKQDWLKWVDNGWLDFVVPMDYQTDDGEFRATVRAQVANTAGKMPIAIGIGSYKHKTPEETLRQIEIARSEGADGYVLFDYKREGMEAILEALTRGPQAHKTYPAYQAAHGTGHFVSKESYMEQQMAMLDPRTVRRDLAPASLIKRKDDVPASVIGGKALVRMTFLPNNVTGIKHLSAQLFVESLNGRQLSKLSGVVIPESAAPSMKWVKYSLSLSNSPTVAAGRNRMVIRGTITRTNGQVEPFIIRGPIIEGLPPAQIAQLQAREKPPEITGTGRRIAVYSDGMASSGLLKALQSTPGLNPYPIYRLRPDHWKSAQVLILPQLNDVAELTPEIIKALRDWVAGGGVLLLTHDAVGFRWHPRLFPEVGYGTALSPQRRLRVLAGRSGAAAAIFEHAYADHVVLQPAPGANVVAVEVNEGEDAPGSTPVALSGKFGQGKVIMYGALLGYASNGVVPEGERELLVELVSNP